MGFAGLFRIKLICMLAVLAFPSYALAQYEPEVRVDTSVLRNYPQTQGTKTVLKPPANFKLKPVQPEKKARRPSLIGPESTSNLQNENQMAPAMRPAPSVQSAPAVQEPIPPAETKITKFPIKTRMRSESNDPSLGKSIPVPYSIPEIKNTEITEEKLFPVQKSPAQTEKAPRPDKKPALAAKSAVKNKPVKTTKSTLRPYPEGARRVSPDEPFSRPAKTVTSKRKIKQSAPKIATNKIPLPPRRPNISEASRSFVNKARKSIENQPGPPVMAMPPEHVETEELEIVNTDNTSLEESLIVPDPQQLADKINTLTPFPETKAKNKKQAQGNVEKDLFAFFKNSDSKGATKTPRPPPEDNYEQEFLSFAFEKGQQNIDHGLKQILEDQAVDMLMNNPGWRVQIQSFAAPSSEKDQASARRISLSRALELRSFLIEKGIQSRRMDVRALGMQTDRTPADRIDLVFFDPGQS
jgi:outer membrane protein OmpA-like peptidoglycan-associated protein